MNGLPASLEGIRPAQAGMVLRGRPTCAQIAATLVDLALRDVLRVEQLSNGTSVDWLLTLQRRSDGDLTAYEKVLLKKLFGSGDRLWFAAFHCSHTAGMNRVGAALRRDAVRAGWLRRWRKGEWTKQGEGFRAQVQAFRRSFRDDGLPVDTVALRRLLPYAVVFGLVSRPEQVPPLHHQLVSFALAWISHCEDLPGWRPRLGPVEPSSSYSERHYPPPIGGGGGEGIGIGV